MGFVDYDMLKETLSDNDLLKVCKKIVKVADMCLKCKTEQGDHICLNVTLSECVDCPFHVKADDYNKAKNIINRFKQKGVIENETVKSKQNKNRYQ